MFIRIPCEVCPDDYEHKSKKWVNSMTDKDLECAREAKLERCRAYIRLKKADIEKVEADLEYHYQVFGTI
jgi:hypothetical protein